MKHDYKKLQEDVRWEDITEGGAIYAEGNSKHFKTGDWRTKRPIWIEEKCRQCLLCFPYCPDSSIPLTGDKRIDFNFDHCKGCGICEKVCPFEAIEMVEEE